MKEERMAAKKKENKQGSREEERMAETCRRRVWANAI